MCVCGGGGGGGRKKEKYYFAILFKKTPKKIVPRFDCLSNYSINVHIHDIFPYNKTGRCLDSCAQTFILEIGWMYWTPLSTIMKQCNG